MTAIPVIERAIRSSGLFYGPSEARTQEQVFGGIARQGQLGEDDEPGAQGVACLRRGLDHARRVARDVADHQIKLGERDAQPGHRLSNPIFFALFSLSL